MSRKKRSTFRRTSSLGNLDGKKNYYGTYIKIQPKRKPKKDEYKSDEKKAI